MFRNFALASFSTLFAVSAMPARECEPQVLTDYETSRRVFLELSNKVVSNPNYGTSEIRPSIKPLKVKYSDRPDEDLTMDALIIPARKQKTLVVQINSGIHGLEAPTGSYLQQHFLMKCLPSMSNENLDQTTFVITHALNPWGFKHSSRFNANNVDLNRNCGGALADGGFDVCYGGQRNFEYGKMKPLFDELVQSDTPIGLRWCKFRVGLASVIKGGTDPFGFGERALRGQTQDPNGIYYAGGKPQPECEIYEDFSKRFYEGEDAHQHSLTITWHTGYGDLGHLQYMGDPSDLKSPKLVDVLENQVVKKDDVTKLDFCPSFKTCNDENVWLRNVEPDRKPDKDGTSLNAYLTAEIGGQGGLASICAVLMSQQLRPERSKPLFEKGSQDETKFKEQIFEAFNPTDDKTYLKRLSDHATNSCEAIKRYIQAVVHPQTIGRLDPDRQCPN